MIRTGICDLFGIEHPIVLAGMGGVCMAPLVAAVSNAGGLGVIGAALMQPEELRHEIRRTRELTDRPFGVDLLAPIPETFVPYLGVIYEEQVRIFVAGLAVPEKYIAEMHSRGIKVVVMVGRVKHAQRAEAAGADVVVAQGTEAGGHTGEIGTMALVPQVVDAVSIPVLAAGGIVDGRGLVAALALGAQGVVMGTRFVATEEATVGPAYRAAVLEVGSDDTVRTRCFTGKTLRSIRNRYIEEWEREPQRIRPFPEQAVISVQNRVMNFHLPDADRDRSCMPAGQGLGMIREIKPAARVVAEVMAEAEALIASGVVRRTRGAS